MSVDCKKAWKRQESAKIPLRLNKIKTRKFVSENDLGGKKAMKNEPKQGKIKANGH